MRIDKNTTIRLGDRNIVKIKIGDSVIWEKKTEVDADYFYIESLSNGNTVNLKTNLKSESHTPYITPTIEYSTDKQNWTTITFDWSTTGVKDIKIPIVLDMGDKIYFRNDTNKFSINLKDYTSHITFLTNYSGKVNVGGDIRTLLNYRNVENTILEDGMFSNLFSYTYGGTSAAVIVDASNLKLPFTKMTKKCYYEMFDGCYYLTSTPELPATTLENSCYSGMFYGCSKLTTVPELPATILSERCYSDMFRGCSKLTTVPELPATTLAYGCYSGMFYGCSKLTTVPKLPVTTLATSCYSSMFSDCTSLTTAPALPATTLAYGCYNNMFRGCSKLTTAPALPATTLAYGCYNGMFWDCASLINAPELPATTLDNGCYQYMFQGCTSLTTAPELPATTLERNCYNSMFQGCRKLNSITVYADDISATNCTNNWLDNVASSGTFNNMGSATYTKDSVNGIPTGWVEKKPNETDYFYIESLGDGNTVSVINKGDGNTTNVTPTLEYSTDKKTWTNITFDWTSGTHTTALPILNTGEKVYFRNDTRLFSNNYTKYILFSPSVSSNVGGDIRTLSNYLDVDNETTTQKYMFYYLFYNNKNIVDASNLRLPYTTLANYCYNSMFQGCTSLTTSPTELPATTLANYCYYGMFRDCTSLTTTPVLPATTLTPYCYYDMFRGCTSLTTAPELPASTIAGSCYYGMFRDCTSLITAPTELPATTLANSCYYSMFMSCTSLITAPTELPATTLENYCYRNMFYGCTNLTTVPALPATTLADSCYYEMFYGCTSLITAPTELPATTFADNCCNSMFRNCTSLTTAPTFPNATTMGYNCCRDMFNKCTSLVDAPALPATTLASDCYISMFDGCEKLTTAPALPATTLANSCYSSMFMGCTSLTTAPELPATILAKSCYNWMFNNCNKLNSITVYAEDISASGCTDSWLDNVASSGTFNNVGFAPFENGKSGIPTGWTEVAPPIESITANPDTFTIKSYKSIVTCKSTLTITTTTGITTTHTNSATITVGENTGDTTRTIVETIPYKGSSYQVTIVQTANDVRPPLSWNVVSDGTYPFQLNTNGYYESTNKGQSNSYSYATLNYEGYDNLVLECINSSYSNYDYGIISQPDVQLSESTSDDGATGSTKVFKNFRSQSSTNPVQIVIPSDEGSHFITIKYIKYIFGNFGNDSLQFRVIEP